MIMLAVCTTNANSLTLKRYFPFILSFWKKFLFLGICLYVEKALISPLKTASLLVLLLIGESFCSEFSISSCVNLAFLSL